MKNKQKSLEIAMEYRILRDREVNRYIQIRDAHPDYDTEKLKREVWRLQALFEAWAGISHILSAKEGNK
jgi:hypothetical protein